MAVSATIVSAWKDSNSAYLSVRVEGDGGKGVAAEYLGSTPLVDGSGNPKSQAQIKADLVAACKAKRDGQQKLAPADLGISGLVSL